MVVEDEAAAGILAGIRLRCTVGRARPLIPSIDSYRLICRRSSKIANVTTVFNARGCRAKIVAASDFTPGVAVSLGIFRQDCGIDSAKRAG
jgi:hypothetical protein